MVRNESQIHYASKYERLLGMIIFVFMILSFFLHLFGFGLIFFKDIQKDNSTLTNNENLFDMNLLPYFCIFTHLIWTIVPIIILDQCCLANNKSFYQILLKLFICTCPLLLSSELSMIFVCHLKLIEKNFLFIIMKWFIFIATILISFWTGTLTNKDKCRAIHGGQIAPEIHTTFYLSFR